MATHPTETDVRLRAPSPQPGNGLAPLEAGPSAAPAQLPPSPLATLLVPDGKPLPATRRLLVLVPGPISPTELASRIWILASAGNLEVLFVGIVPDAAERYAMRRLLAILAAATRDGRLKVDTRLELNKTWAQAVQALWQPGDLIVCHAEQSIPYRGFRQRPLAETLVSTLNVPVYVLTGFCLEASGDRPRLARPWLRLILPVTVIAGFFVVQTQIGQLPKDWLYFTLMTLSIVVELGLLVLWH